MNIRPPSINDIGTNYVVRLSEREFLVSKERDESSPDETQEVSLQKTDDTNELSEDEKRHIRELEARDAEVKAHEQAHQMAGGALTGAASFTYQIGPDGKMYAIGGEVPISTPTPSSPEEAINIARQVVAAAMAPSAPSAQDFAVASSARMMEIKAQQELSNQEQSKTDGIQSYKDAQGSTQREEPRELLIDISA